MAAETGKPPAGATLCRSPESIIAVAAVVFQFLRNEKLKKKKNLTKFNCSQCQ
jgi:hypothetical protein